MNLWLEEILARILAVILASAVVWSGLVMSHGHGKTSCLKTGSSGKRKGRGKKR